MDLSFPRPRPDADAVLPPEDVAALAAALPKAGDGVAVTDVESSDGSAPPVVPGAFNPAMAARLAAWRQA